MLELTVLGAAGSYPAYGLACSGYLISDGRYTLLVDLGAGSLANVPSSIELRQIDAVLITHLHPDHYSDIFVLEIYLEFFSGRNSPLPLYAPASTDDKLRALPWNSPKGFDGNFNFTAWNDGGRLDIGPFVVRSVKTTHIEPTYALRVEEKSGAAITYSADTGPSDAVEELASGSDLLLAEATWLEAPPSNGVGHLTPEQAGQMARRCGARELVLTHLWPTVDPSEALRRARLSFGSRVSVAEVGKVYPIDGAT